ncbi:hypothetical protein HNQ56_000025 [Anaerotaenia torta]|uniref:hypothetical protein n=1 Tax=Anaerotaenia torta TaxID=433293 RepID=UPI003D21317A
MSLRRGDKEESRRKKVDISMEDVVHFVKFITVCSGALLIFSLFAFLLTGNNPGTNVIYAMVVGINAFVFFTGLLFLKKTANKE